MTDQPKIRAKKAPLIMTQNAVERIKFLLSKRDRPSIGIRVSVKSGGCSGLTYVIEYADDLKPFEEKVSQDGVDLIVDPKAMMYLIGSEMDFVEEKFKSGFTFRNPNEKARCGCGESFTV